MKQTFEKLFLTIVEDGGKVTVGDKTFNVTLAEAEKDTEKIPVGEVGKWYRYVKNNSNGDVFTKHKWYECIGDTTNEWAFIGNNGNKDGFFPNNHEYFDLSTPLDIDPETLVGKEVKFEEWDRSYRILAIKEDRFIVETLVTTVAYYLSMFNTKKHELRDPETTLTVPDNVEFYDWLDDISLRYNGFILSPYKQGNNFVLSNTREVSDQLKSPLQLVPCKLSEVKNGDWVVTKDVIDNPIAYRLKTEKGWISFDVGDEYPITIEKEFLDLIDWLKVVQG